MTNLPPGIVQNYRHPGDREMWVVSQRIVAVRRNLARSDDGHSTLGR